AVLDHRAELESTHGLEARRASQQLEWLWSLVNGEVLDAVKRSPRVKALRKVVEAEIGAGDLSALEGAEQLVKAFVEDVPSLWSEA
ncbi:MAG: methylmalonyl Co-A mutase-associated GTPase MeaB, partial [Micropruina sp.]